jgi:uncharacterized protein with HEPN domain
MKRDRPDRDPAYRDDILTAIGAIRTYMHGKTRAQFDRSPMLRDAVMRQLGIIGEAAANLSAAFKANYPRVPWKSIVGLRQILLHRYWNVEPDIVWNTAKKDIRDLGVRLRRRGA